MKKLRILIIGNDYVQQFPLTDYGGIESSVENTCYGLQNYTETIDYCVIVPKRQTKIDTNFKVFESNEYPTRLSGRSAYNYIEDVKNIIIKSEIKPDIIWSQSDWSAKVLKDLNIPIICTSQDSAINEGHTGKFIYNNNIKYRFVSKFLLDNNFNLNDTIQKRIYNNSFYLHTGLSDENFVFYPKKENYVLWVAGLNWGYTAKGLDDFIKLSQINTDIEFVCYGSGNQQLENYLQDQSKKLKNLHYMGILKRGKEHNDAFGKAKFFLMLSKIPEAFGRTTIESLSKGTPVICYNNGATPELINDPNVGYIANQDDLNDISKKLYEIYDYKKCFEFSKKYHINNEINELINQSNNFIKKLD